MKKKFTSISGVTLLEMLIGIVISALMMAALYTSYTAVNNSYSQVSDRANISRTGRDIIGMMLRDIRMAGYFDVKAVKIADPNMHPLFISKSNIFKGTSRKCDSIVIVYGDVNYNKGADPEFTYPIYRTIYQCKKSKIPNRKGTKNAAGNFPNKDLWAIYKSKERWNITEKKWEVKSTDKKTHESELVIDHVEDLIFFPLDEKGKLILPPPQVGNINQSRLYDIRSVDMLIILRSPDHFFKKKKIRPIQAFRESGRKQDSNDRYLRESITATAHTRNIGIAK